MKRSRSTDRAIVLLHWLLGLSVLRDDQGFSLFPERTHNLGGVGFEVTDTPNPTRRFHLSPTLAGGHLLHQPALGTPRFRLLRIQRL